VGGISRETYVAFVRETRRWLGHPGERLVGSRLPNKPQRQKAKKNGDVGRGEDGERKRKKNENGRDVGLYPGISSWRERVVERDHPRAL